jgi:tetratricopeptide (TPR) repeat protein
MRKDRRQGDNVEELLARIEALEQEVATLRAAPGARVTAPFQVLDDEGKVVFDVSVGPEGPRLGLLSAGGTPIGSLRAGPDGGARLWLRRDGAERSCLGLFVDEAGGYVAVYDQEGHQVASLGCAEGSDGLTVWQKNQEPAVRVTQSRDGGQLRVCDHAGRPSAVLTVGVQGGELRIRDEGGRLVASLGCSGGRLPAQRRKTRAKRAVDAALEMHQAECPREALACLNVALEDEPERYEALVRMGELYTDCGPELGLAEPESFATAVTYFNRAIEVDPDNPEAYAERGKPLLYLERYEEALECARMGLARLDPRQRRMSPDVWRNLAESLYRVRALALKGLGRRAEGLQVLEEGLARFPSSEYLSRTIPELME